MNQTIFETRQRGQELLKKAIAIWQQSSNSDMLEGLDQDPVFGLLMSAVAYIANETDAEISRMKSDVLEEFARMLTPYQVGHATPATVCVGVTPSAGVGDVVMDSDKSFMLADSEFRFTPVLRSRALALSVGEVTKRDGRTWEVTLNCDSNVRDLSHFAFVVNNKSYRQLRVFVADKELPLIHPWEYSEFPRARIFSLEDTIGSWGQCYDPTPACEDLFARHDLRLYMVRSHRAQEFIPYEEMDKIQLRFLFEGVTPNFNFSKEQLLLNPVVLANAFEGASEMDRTMPIARAGDEKERTQFMYLLQPVSDQHNAISKINVREVMADRFNRGTLLHLISSLLGKLNTDFYAFQELNMDSSTQVLGQLVEVLRRLQQQVSEGNWTPRGTYLMLEKGQEALSLRARYALTNGAAVNAVLAQGAQVVPVGGYLETNVKRVGSYIAGTDSISQSGGSLETLRYAVATNCRIVTPSDMRLFCESELMRRYGISHDMITSMRIQQRQLPPDRLSQNGCGFVIEANITLVNSPFIKRSFRDQAPYAEVMLEKMMQTRSTNIYPIAVNIRIED